MSSLETTGRERNALRGSASLGRYEVILRLAVGGMAELFLARAVSIGGFEKLVVLKRILPQYANQPRFVSMFLDEARLAARLHHPNIAQVFDIGEEDGEYFFAMEYVHGQNVRQLWERCAEMGAELSLENALEIVQSVARALQYAHEVRDDEGRPINVVHRDVSPSNVIISYEGAVKLVDFGIAKAENRSMETTVGSVKGKYAYMSPEQCRAESLDRRSDIFSLGIVLYELTTGTRLFDCVHELGVLSKIVDGEIDPPTTRVRNYPADLERIVMRSLAVDRETRYTTARELLDDLHTFCVEHRLSPSENALAPLMHQLFGDELATWASVVCDERSFHTLDVGPLAPWKHSRVTEIRSDGDRHGRGSVDIDVDGESRDETGHVELSLPYGAGVATLSMESTAALANLSFAAEEDYLHPDDGAPGPVRALPLAAPPLEAPDPGLRLGSAPDLATRPAGWPNPATVQSGHRYRAALAPGPEPASETDIPARAPSVDLTKRSATLRNGILLVVGIAAGVLLSWRLGLGGGDDGSKTGAESGDEVEVVQSSTQDRAEAQEGAAHGDADDIADDNPGAPGDEVTDRATSETTSAAAAGSRETGASTGDQSPGGALPSDHTAEGDGASQSAGAGSGKRSRKAGKASRTRRAGKSAGNEADDDGQSDRRSKGEPDSSSATSKSTWSIDAPLPPGNIDDADLRTLKP